MKIILAIIVLALISFGVNAKPVKSRKGDKIDVCYVKTGDKVYFGKDIKMGLIRTKVILPEGKVEELKNCDITSYMHHNRLYELLPVICENNDTICYAFLEYLTSRSGLKLYRYCCTNEIYPQFTYFVFKDNMLYLRINKENALATFPFFNVSYVLR